MTRQGHAAPGIGQSTLLVVHTDAAANGDWSIETETLAAAGARFVPTRSENEDELIANVRDADAVVVGLAKVSRRVIGELTRTKAIVRYGVGYDSVDIPAATERGIAVCNIPDYCTEEVANHALALLLAVNRRIVQQDAHVRSGGWRGGSLAPMGSLYGETAGIIGYGRIGRAMAARCRVLGMRVLAADPYAGTPESTDQIVPLDELLATADYISIHCLLNDETHGLINEAALRRMKHTAILVNTARGPIVDQAAITRALTEGWIAGAGLDVLEEEPPIASEPLRGLPNVLLTPHTAYYTDRSSARLKHDVAHEVIEALAGRRPPHLLNPQVWKG